MRRRRPVTAAFMQSRTTIADGLQQEAEAEEKVDKGREKDCVDCPGSEAQEKDLVFLEAFLVDPLIRSLIQVRGDDFLCAGFAV